MGNLFTSQDHNVENATVKHLAWWFCGRSDANLRQTLIKVVDTVDRNTYSTRDLSL